MRRVLPATLALLLPAGVSAREPDPQQHEVTGSVEISVQQGANAALVDGQYTFTPAGIDRNDDEPPVLRRFLSHPASVWLHLVHDGGTREAISSIRAGMEINPLGGRLFGSVEGGVGRHLTLFSEPLEYGFFFATLSAEVGVRPVDRVRVSAFYEGQPVLGADRSDKVPNQAERTGMESTFGGAVTFVTPTDRIFATVTGFGHVTDWTFNFLNPGDMSVRGFGASFRVALLVNPATTLQLRGQLVRDHWVDGRLNDDSTAYVGASLDRQVWRGSGAADLIYYNKARYGFRLSLGGGYEGAPPLVNTKARGVFSLGGGVLIRF